MGVLMPHKRRDGKPPPRWLACHGDGNPAGEPTRSRSEAETQATLRSHGMVMDRQTGRFFHPVTREELHPAPRKRAKKK